jgi:hypothetical protein
MANSAQLSKNNQNAQVWVNWGGNTERDFKTCIKEVFESLTTVYPQYQFIHLGKVNNQTLIESFNRYSPTHVTSLNGSDAGGCNPDGGVIYIKCADDKYMPVFIGENKHQDDNPGNALERAIKNIEFFKGILIAEDYFPYLININGPIVNDKKGSYFDRVTQVGGFMTINTVHVKSDPATPRLRPFTVLLDKEFDYDKVKTASLSIIAEAVDYLAGNDKLITV